MQSSKRRRSLQRRKRHLTLDSTGEEETKHRAYEIYLERGEQAGRDLDDWLQTELEWERPAFRVRKRTSKPELQAS